MARNMLVLPVCFFSLPNVVCRSHEEIYSSTSFDTQTFTTQVYRTNNVHIFSQKILSVYQSNLSFSISKNTIRYANVLMDRLLIPSLILILTLLVRQFLPLIPT